MTRLHPTFRRCLALIGALGLLATLTGVASAKDKEESTIGQVTVGAELFARWLQTETEADGGFHPGRSHVILQTEPAPGATLRVVVELDPDGTDRTRLREGYWQQPMSNAYQLRIGVQATPMVEADEARLWGLRFVAPSFLEFWHLTPAADSAASLLGQTAGGGLDYHLSIANGEGYNQPIEGSGQALSGRIGLHDGPWELGAFIYKESRHNGILGHDPKRQVYYLNYASPSAAIGGQYISGDDGTISTEFNDLRGYSIHARLTDGTSTLFYRRDKLTPIDNGPAQRLTLVGMALIANANVIVSGYYQLRDFGPYDEASGIIAVRLAL